MFERLSLHNVRTHKKFNTQFSNATNIIIGPNASGKTTILETLYVLAQGKSFKGPLKHLINSSCDWAKIAHEEGSNTQEVRLKKAAEAVTKEFINNQHTSKQLPRNKRSPVSLFEPGQLRILTGSPERRRDFFDTTLSQILSEYAAKRNQYTKALRQRNALLKKSTLNKEHIFVWDMKLAETGHYLCESRNSLVEQINKKLSQTYKEIAGKRADIRLTYTSELLGKSKEAILGIYSTSQEKDRLLGHTTFGAHRDDIIAHINGREAAVSASRGETRTIMLCLKLIEIGLIQNTQQKKPILLLDDVFGELDGRRRTLLTEVVADFQAVITTTDADIVTKEFLGKSTIIPTKTN